MCMAKEAVQFVNRFGPGDIAAESGRIPGECKHLCAAAGQCSYCWYRRRGYKLICTAREGWSSRMCGACIVTLAEQCPCGCRDVACMEGRESKFQCKRSIY